MRSFRLILLLLLFCTVAEGQTQPSEVEKERLAEFHRIETEAARLPILHADSIEQAVKLGVKYDMLEAQTSLQSQNRESRLIIPSLKGVVRFTLFGPRPAELGGSFFDLLQMDLTDPSIGQVYTRVSSYAGRVSIVRDSEWGDAFMSVQLLQDAPPQPGVAMEEPPIRLYVQRTHVEGNEPPVQWKLQAMSFILLRLEHHREIDRYVRPIIQDLKQERGIFAVPDQYAWAALGSSQSTDPSIMAMITTLLPRLDSEDFQVRAKASEELVALDFPKLLALEKIDRTRLSDQQRSEINAILDESLPLPISRFRAMADNPNFVLDVLYSEDPQLRRVALDRLRVLTSKQIEFDIGLTRDQRDTVIARLRSELIGPTSLPAP